MISEEDRKQAIIELVRWLAVGAVFGTVGVLLGIAVKSFFGGTP